jgi:adenosine deaminase
MHKTSRDASLRSALAALPKIDLHRHLEGSLRLSTLREIALQYRLDLPTRNLEELRPYVQVTNDEPNYRNFLEKFNVLRRFYQSPEIIHRFTYECIEDAAKENIRYLELRFTPMALAKTQGYKLHEVTHWVLTAVEKARQDFPAIQVELIANLNRHESMEIAQAVAQIAVEHKEDIVALDIGGDEVNFSAAPFAPLFREAKRAGLGITAHAGEWTGPATVRHAIEELGAERIGHGVRVVEDPNVAALARERGVAFEVCVTSNLQSGVIQRMADHPLRDMDYLKLKTTLNTDDPSISDITLTDEYEVVVEDLGFALDDVKAAILTAAACAFQPAAKREKLVQQFKAALMSAPDSAQA